MTATEIDAEMKAIWPAVFCVPSDREYYCPSENEFTRLALDAKVKINNELGVTNIGPIFECEDLALVMIAEIKKIRVKRGEKYSLPAAIVFGVKFNGWSAEHWAIYIRCQEGPRLFDPATMEIWVPSKVDDAVLYGLM